MKTQGLGHNAEGSIVRRSKVAQQRRQKIASEFRGRLERELAATGNTTLGQEVLIAMATSLWCELSEGNAAFLRGTATPQALARLAHSRSQLLRTMKSLGLIVATDEEPELQDRVPSVAEYIATFNQQRGSKARPELADK
jgi:hypothetical protein